ncbi:retinol dehydrogenase 8-like [Diadema antillarum]|uniref:retinol dehydrogenase 8-like n=1 Tax=Diadema antillarum TaxID=105358 RepID=UPI003A8AF4AA
MATGVVLITGCSSGIGLSTAVKLAQDPKKSFLVYATMRNLAKKGELVEAAGSALNRTLFILQLDITKEEQIVSVIKEIMKRHSRIDIIVNNAAFGYLGLFEQMPMADMRKMMETNMVGTYRLIQEVIPIMKRQKSGRIINISSLGGISGFPFGSVYASTKFAMEGLTESLYPELRCFGVWITSICPGGVVTKFSENMSSNKTGSADLHQAAKGIDPNDKSGQILSSFIADLNEQMMPSSQQPEDIADVVIECLAAGQPKVRYFTSDLGKGMMAQKYADGIGANGSDMWYQMMVKTDTA